MNALGRAAHRVLELSRTQQDAGKARGGRDRRADGYCLGRQSRGARARAGMRGNQRAEGPSGGRTMRRPAQRVNRIDRWIRSAARAPGGAGGCVRRCRATPDAPRMRPMTCGSSMLAMILTAPPHCSQRSISMPKTRLRRCAHVIAACFGTALPCPSPDPSRPA
jgi:hypothetical protein